MTKQSKVQILLNSATGKVVEMVAETKGHELTEKQKAALKEDIKASIKFLVRLLAKEPK